MKYKITLNNRVYEVEVEAGEAILAAEYEAAAPAPAAPAAPVAAAPAAPAAPIAEGEAFPAPLPGVVVDIKVAAGTKVTAGQVVLVVEAMKKENEIAAPKDGTIVQKVAIKGQSVNSGDTLFVIG